MTTEAAQLPDSPCRRVLLGVCGGIAAYKAVELARRLRDRGLDVQVVMSRSAQEFVTPTTFQAVTGRPVRADLWDADAEAAMGHIELARWADVILVAPATAHFMASLAHGFAGDLLSTLCLASEAPIVLAPAMNRIMWANPATQANRALLESRGVRIIGPASGKQACGEEGPGRMVEPEEIVAALESSVRPQAAQSLRGLRIVVTAGPTREPIDPVRYITNRSSGKMGFAVAEALSDAGGDVVLVSGPVALPTPRGVDRIDVETAADMHDAVHARIRNADIFVACAAVSDYRPEQSATSKIKRHADTLQMDLVRSPDILASVAALPQAPFTVGFAAETDRVEEHARLKLQNKHIDMIAANKVGRDCGFDLDTNELHVIWPGGSILLEKASKRTLAARLAGIIAERFRLARPARVEAHAE
jgi:phosphopantothenoylcysteine decarboxylase/phosphopantothenate--cysteine ligase